MAIDALQNQHSRYGAIARALPFTFGNIFLVVSPSVAYTADTLNIFPQDLSGRVRIFTDVAKAYAQMTSNQNDVMILDSNSTFTLTEMLTISKSRCHFYGLDYFLGSKRAYGQRTKISLTATTGATNLATVLNLGAGNKFHNIKFINGSTVAEGIYGFIDGGNDYTEIHNCEFYKSTDLDVTGAADFVCNADSGQYFNCTFGSLADARSGSVIRPNVLFTKGIAGSGLVTRDATFTNCNFWIQCTDTANRFVYGANATDVERLALFDDCKFICNGASSAIPAQNVAFGAPLTVGSVLLNNCVGLNASTAMSTTTGVFVNGAVPAAATTGIAVQAS